jgi:hypothetical protein
MIPANVIGAPPSPLTAGGPADTDIGVCCVFGVDFDCRVFVALVFAEPETFPLVLAAAALLLVILFWCRVS